MRRLTLIRHGLTAWNATGRFQGQTDVPLSDAGRDQARRLRQRVAGVGDDLLLYASPLRRARETAELAFPGREVRVDARLSELHFGTFEGATLAENRAHPEWDRWYAEPYLRSAPGGESYRQLRERAVAWLAALPQDAAEVVAVTHSGTIQMLLVHVLGVEHPRWRKRIYLRHTSLSRIVFQGDETLIERVNDTRHLHEADSDPFLD